HRLSTLREDMDDQEVVETINDETTPEKLHQLVQQGRTTSFIFSLKNRLGGLARALKVFQEHGINVVHIESRLSRRNNSEYEIYVDLEADRQRVKKMMLQLQRQVSCVRLDNVLSSSNSMDYAGDANDVENDVFTEGHENNIDQVPQSPFLDANGEPIQRKSM
ncbi:unnamed protein product, partial [Didymodactylos carnosus]